MSATRTSPTARCVADPRHDSELRFGRSLTREIQRATDVPIESRIPEDRCNVARLARRAVRNARELAADAELQHELDTPAAIGTARR